MSKYTTEVRYICEQKAGLTESIGFNNINSVLEKSWDKIFTTNWEIFNESYRKILCEKILRSYYTREICAETVGLWQLWLDSTLCEIMPMYNQLYKTTIYKFNPLYTTDMTTTFAKTVKGNDSKTGKTNSSNDDTRTDDYMTTDSGNSSTTGKTNHNSKNSHNESLSETNKYNDTPQGGITGLETGKYLTDVRMIHRSNLTADSNIENGTNYAQNSSEGKTNNKGTTKNTGKSSAESSEIGISETTETWTEKVIGKNNSENYGQLLIEFRKSIINIDKMIIDELKPLFMQLW